MKPPFHGSPKSSRASVRPRSPGLQRPRLEPLEDRVVPAFTVADTLTTVAFTGDAANDALILRSNGTRIEYSANGGAFVALANARTDTVTSFVVRGGGGNDTLDLGQLGGALTALAALGGGCDIRGEDGDDVLTGTDLNDTLDGGTGLDTLRGGKGDDALQAMDWQTDTLDGGLGRDSAWFESTDNGPVSVEVWNPAPQAADNAPQRVKVLVVNFDPLIPSQGDRRLWEVFNWGSPYDKAAGYEEAIERTSGGAVDVDIVEWRNLNQLPMFTDGSQYMPDQNYQNRLTNTGWYSNVSADVPRIFAEQNLVPLINSGAVDEVWFFADHYFLIGGESFKVGPGSFFINGPSYPEVPLNRAIACMGFSYERGVAEMLHNNSHRTESTMNRVYGGWNLANPQGNWDRFSANAQQSNGMAGVGTCHYPTNGVSDYDYANARTVQSFADDYLDYPSLDGTLRPVSRDAWGKDSNPDYQRSYLEWYFTHLPRAAGTNPDGRQNNWWKYLYDFTNYTPTGQPLPLRVQAAWADDLYNLGGDTHTITVAYSSATPIAVSSLDANDVAVRAPDGTLLPVTFVGVNDSTDGTYRVATYRVTAPGGTWDAADLGRYTVTLNANQVQTVLGESLAAQPLVAFLVRTEAAGPLTADSATWLGLPLNGTAAGAARPAARRCRPRTGPAPPRPPVVPRWWCPAPAARRAGSGRRPARPLGCFAAAGPSPATPGWPSPPRPARRRPGRWPW